MPPAFEPALGVPSGGSSPPPVVIEPIVYVNGKRKVLPDGYAETTLLEYLREIGLVGTKLGCGEGGCGACTVMVSHFDPLEKKIVHRSVNACLAPLYSVEGMHVVTVEGIGNRRDGLHPVQERLAHAHGSQCGFCTPGFIMSMYTLLRSSPEAPSQAEIEENLAGNLCRCTGYRPIVDAFRAFAKKEPQAHTQDSLAANGVTGVTPANSDVMVCPSTGQPCGCGAKSGAETGGCEEGECETGGCGKGGCETGKCEKAGCENGRSKNGRSENGACGEKCEGGEKLLTRGEPIFPPELKTRKAPVLSFAGSRGSLWHRPVSLPELLTLKKRFPAAKLVVGNTEVGIEMRFKKLAYPVLIGTTHVAEMNEIRVTDAGIELGASVTLTRLMETCKKAVKERPIWQTSGCVAIAEQLRWFAGNQIRNVSSIGGNVVTGSPISDLNPLWMATGAVFRTASLEGKPREVPARNFFLGYRKVDLTPDEVLASVFLPWTRPYEYVKEFKQAHRRDDDIALVNAGMRVAFERKNEEWVVKEASLAYGGVAAITLPAPRTESALIGRPWTDGTLQLALQTIPTDVIISDSAPGGMPEFRRSLTTSFFFKLYVLLSGKLEVEAGGFRSEIPATVRSAAQAYERPASRGSQYFDTGNANEAVGKPLVHASAETQVTGEAQYVDDIALPANGLYGGLVLSTKPHAKLLSVDASEALDMPGVAGFFAAKDVPGGNAIGAAAHDEEVFATEKVTCVGQVIGIVVADSEMRAKLAAAKVKVEYEELPAVIDMHQAIQAKSFIKGTERTLKNGDVDACFASGACFKICEGEVRIGGQEHFYLEPNSSLCLPGEAGEEMTVISSTQAPTHTQQDVAKALGIAQHKVISKARRIGGGFGGKETRTAFISCAAAIAAYWLKRPVRVTLDRDQDMAITGQRHAFVGKYKVGFTEEGKILALDVDLYNNGGNSLDLSLPVLERAIYHSENCYQIPNIRVHGWVCYSNKPTNTAFRGFGGPQGMLVVESWIDRVAHELGKSRTEIQELNMEKEGDVTYFGQTLENSTMRRIWAELKATSKHEETSKAVAAFNAENRYRKRGLAIVPTRFGISFTAKFMNQAGALVHVYTDGTVLVTHGGIEMGQGLHTKMAQVAATAFNIPVSNVFIQETSTDKVPNTSPTAASASSDLYGAAVHNACEQIIERMAPIKANLPEDASFAKLAAACYFERIDLSAHGFYRTPDLHFDFATGKGRPFNYFTYGAAASEVEIDTLTGDMTVRKTDIVMDLGRSLNPAIDIGQIEGAYVQGLGWCVIEEVKWGDAAHPWVRPGHLFTQGPGTYKLPTVNDIPIDFQVALLKNATNPRAIHSSKAVGEPPLFLAASAFFAIKDAIAAARRDAGCPEPFVLDSPATPERIRMACVDDFTKQFAPVDLRPKLSV